MPEFKDMLKFFRLREGLSQSELAEKLGMSASRISMYEVGKREPDFETEERIADFFNTDLNTLRGRDREMRVDYMVKNDDGLEILVETQHPYYLNEETKAIAQEIFENKELRMLFDVSRNASPERLKAYYNLIKAMQDTEKGND